MKQRLALLTGRKTKNAKTTGVEMVSFAATYRKEEGNRTRDTSVSVLSLIFLW